MKRLTVLGSFILLVGACGGGSDADVAGTYQMQITNRDNGCNFANYTVGDSGQATVVVTQTDSNVSATVMGGGGFALALVLGSNVYVGDVSGNDLDLKIEGTRAFNDGNCAFTYNSEIKGSLSGDSLMGKIEYRAVTNNNSDCATHTGCLTFQEFAGSRPPK